MSMVAFDKKRRDNENTQDGTIIGNRGKGCKNGIKDTLLT
jgi:hypothetical protein